MCKVSIKRFLSLLLLISVLLLSLSVPGNTVLAETSYNPSVITDYEITKTYFGFKYLSSKIVENLNSTFMLFRHEKTGARLMFVKNSDNERVFSISFRTPTNDDTGVNHIIEHSVLNGSKNYPVKSPFAEMLKRSLGTFINAMTANDYTIYPVSSVNEKDLQNLMGIYLDAVFYPKLQTEPNIFRQEAWRYQLDSKDSKLAINGIVYNEMKGYYGNPSYVLEREIYKSLFPDSSYKWDAGGNPDVIPTLTTEKFRAVHKNYYNPANSFIFLYGNLDIGKYLEFIDTNYLSKMSGTNADTTLKLQKSFSKMVEKVSYYPVAEDGSTDRKTYMAINFATGNVTDKDLVVGMDYLSDLLMGSENSPLKKILFKSGIADNYLCSFKPDSLQPVFTITAENSDPASKEEYKKLVFDVLKKTAKSGFSSDLIKYTFAQHELSKRTKKLSAMKGLTLNFDIMKSWLYDKDPTLYAETGDSVERIKNLAEKKYFESLINKYLLTNSHSSFVILKPSAGLESKNLAIRNKKLEDYKKGLNTKAVNALIKSTKDFKAWQDKPDPKKDLETIPRLSIVDIKPEIPDLKVKSEKIADAAILSHNVSLNDISSINFYFDTSKVPQDKLYYLNLLASLLGNLETKNYKVDKLTNEVLLYSSGISFSASAAVNAKNPDNYKPIMSASFYTLNENIPKTMDLLEEIISRTSFDNKNKVKQIVQQNKSYMQQLYTSGTGMFSSLKLSAYLSEGGRYIDELKGPGYYRFLSQLDKNFEKEWDNIQENLKKTYSMVFNSNGLIVSHSGDANGFSIFKSQIKVIIPRLSNEVLPSQEYKLTTPDKNMALPLPVKVQTLLKGGKFTDAGYSYNGKMMVLERILNMDYLWKNVRTSGGAYGVNVDFSPSGLMSFISMRDPNLVETLNIFDDAVKYLKDFKATEDEMENFIIGTISEFMKIKSMGPLYEGVICDNLYLTGLTSDDLLIMMNEALSTKAEDIRNYSDMVEKVINQNIYYVEGSKEKIIDNKEIFSRLDSIVN